MTAEPPLPAQCPPAAATPTDGTYFRLVRKELTLGAVTNKGDWRKPYKANVGECSGQVDRCECHALSVYADVADAVRALALIPPYKPKAIAEVRITDGMGVLQRTPSDAPSGPVHDSHHEWWPTPPDLVPNATIVRVAQVSGGSS